MTGSVHRLRVKYETGRPYAIVPKMYQPALTTHKVVFGSIRLERLQAITEADARAEGVGSVDEYAMLWNLINTKRGTRWEDNPWVFVYGEMRVYPSPVERTQP